MTPIATVAISTRNRREELRGALESAVAQEGDVEVLVIDGGSQDQTTDLLAKLSQTRPNVTWVRQSETDPGQRGLERCSGEYVLQLDPRTRLFPQALQRLTTWARTHDLDAVAARIDLEAIVKRVDPDAVIARVDVDATLARLDLAAIARQVIDEIDLPEILRQSTGAVSSEAVREIRDESMLADEALARFVDRVLRRRRAASP